MITILKILFAAFSAIAVILIVTFALDVAARDDSKVYFALCFSILMVTICAGFLKDEK